MAPGKDSKFSVARRMDRFAVSLLGNAVGITNTCSLVVVRISPPARSCSLLELVHVSSMNCTLPSAFEKNSVKFHGPASEHLVARQRTIAAIATRPPLPALKPDPRRKQQRR